MYKLQKKIGSGNFGTVRLGSLWTNPKKLYAIKSIPRDKVEGEESKMLEQELLVLMEVDHPNIIKFYEVYSD